MHTDVCYTCQYHTHYIMQYLLEVSAQPNEGSTVKIFHKNFASQNYCKESCIIILICRFHANDYLKFLSIIINIVMQIQTHIEYILVCFRNQVEDILIIFISVGRRLTVGFNEQFGTYSYFTQTSLTRVREVLTSILYPLSFYPLADMNEGELCWLGVSSAYSLQKAASVHNTQKDRCSWSGNRQQFGPHCRNNSSNKSSNK